MIPDFIEIVEDQEDDVISPDYENNKELNSKESVVDESEKEISVAPSSVEDKDSLELQRIAEREALLERYNEAQAQIQYLNQQVEQIKEHQTSQIDNSVSVSPQLNTKVRELELAKQEYINAKQSFDTKAEIEAMTKFANLQWEIKQLELEKQNTKKNNFNIDQQNYTTPPKMVYNPNEKTLEKLKEFVNRPENTWMSQEFDQRLNPLTPDGLVANNLFTKLSSKGHPATGAFWDLYQHELKKAIPNKYTQRYGKGSPSVAASQNSPAVASKKNEVKLDSWEKRLIERVATDDTSKKRMAKMLKTEAPAGMGKVMFEIGA